VQRSFRLASHFNSIGLYRVAIYYLWIHKLRVLFATEVVGEHIQTESTATKGLPRQ
jgi:hypothetical protein